MSLINVPVFQQLKRISGDRDAILAEILLLAEARSQVWLEVVYEGGEIVGDLRECIEAAILGTEIQLLRIKNNRIIDRVLNRIQDDETLDDLNVNDVFERCLTLHNIPEDQRLDLLCTYQEIITYINEVDVRAE